MRTITTSMIMISARRMTGRNPDTTATTDFIERRGGELSGEISGEGMEDARIAAALGVHLSAMSPPRAGRPGEGERRPDPWSRPGGWIPGGAA